MTLEDKNGTTVFTRTTEYKPPKSWQTWLIGRPLSTADAPHQTIGKAIGLAVFSSDAMSSVAYAPQEILAILALAGVGAFHLSVPIAFGIIGLLVILTLSYEQTIHAYPNGGGSYIVARDNIGKIPSLIAAAALLTDYILTVSVSISSAVAQIVSAFPTLFDYRVWIAIGCIMFVMVINLRGVKESGLAFAIPTYFFIIIMYLTLMVGLFRVLFGGIPQVVDPPALELVGSMQGLTLFLILRAFSSGTAAVTGVEAISDGIMAFKEPRSKNAGQTLIIMACILGSMMLGITFLANQIHAVPSEYETVISQMARTVFNDRGILYIGTITATTIILVMAANTAFADFPRLSAIAAGDGFLPRQLTYRGSRLVYSRGISALAFIASVLIVIFQASVTLLIPLYAIGVFLSFTISQAGMARRWWKSGHLKPGDVLKEKGSSLKYESAWLIKMIINGFGALVTFIVMIIFAVTKFTQGAYIVILLIPLLVVGFSAINFHYRNVARDLSLDNYSEKGIIARHRVIFPIGGVHQGTVAALRYARNLSDDITAVHISTDPEETRRIQSKWEQWGEGYRLQILDSPYRLLFEPLLQYIEEIDQQRQPNEIITIVVPQFVSKNIATNLLHTRTADTLRKILLNREGIVITEVPYQVD